MEFRFKKIGWWSRLRVSLPDHAFHVYHGGQWLGYVWRAGPGLWHADVEAAMEQRASVSGVTRDRAAEALKARVLATSAGTGEA
ncbi:hypothetical protein [Sphingomicrobium nitratireducens]|uniref:hypothetical protein n=1 Tax=Sphingomicrobium nitratireducens TaxID=2964666 RepID=UPI00224060A2|nr:hypothetical protein [Sphingomicrobium nitratireducens]